MKQTYSSVTQFFSDFKAFLLDHGLTLVRTNVPNSDVILDNGNGLLVRLLKKQVSDGIAGVGWEFGTDADVLSVSNLDVERFLPFKTNEGSEFDSGFAWTEDMGRISLCVLSLDPSMPEVEGCRYRINVNFQEGTSSVYHADRFHRQFEPNFKDTSGYYIPAGA